MTQYARAVEFRLSPTPATPGVEPDMLILMEGGRYIALSESVCRDLGKAISKFLNEVDPSRVKP